MRRLTDLVAAAWDDLAGVPRRYWLALAAAVAAEGVLLAKGKEEKPKVLEADGWDGED